MKQDLLKGLTEEQIEKAKACKNKEELLELAKKEGVELNEEQLTAVSGGGCMTYTVKCPKCGSSYIVENGSGKDYHCNACGHDFNDNAWEDIKRVFD